MDNRLVVLSGFIQGMGIGLVYVQLGFARAHAQQYLDTTQLFLAPGGSEL